MLKICMRFYSNIPTMVRVLNVAEKNDAAKCIAEVMSRGGYRKREGFSKFNKIYEFDYNVFSQNCQMSMTSVSGHLLGLDFVGQYKKWYSCNPVQLFDIPVTKHCPDNFIDIKRTLEREVKGCKYLIVWTDCDREGENIGYEVIQVCKEAKPSIQVYRAKFSEITPHAINRAIQNLGPPDKNVSDAVDVRSELDLRIGAAFTRFQTLRLQKVFPDVLSDQLISYGSCQFPTLGFVVERYKQVEAFIPEPFWKIKVTHLNDEIKADFSWKRNRLFNHLACLVLYEQCIELPIATVVDVRSKSKSKWRPQALDTVEMEKLASRKLRINAKETMKIAEKLYTNGFISYPRTETNIFPKELNLTALVEEQTRDPNWGEFAEGILQNGPNPRNGKKTDNAHPPIHPIKYTATLQGNEQKVYEFIVRHFLACVSQDAQGFETTVDIEITDEKFTASGLMIIAKNYLEVYPYEKWNAKEIPVYNIGDKFEPSSIELISSETAAPPLLTEADLIALMDKHGIGTDATHAEHIETIKSRSYVGLRPDGKFVPGHLGMGLVEGYDSMGYEMSKPNLRANLENDLKLICEGRKDKNIALQEQIQKYKQVFIQACEQAARLDEALAQYLGEARPFTAAQAPMPEIQPRVKTCPNCNQDMVLKTKKDGKGFYIGCMGYPDCRNAIWLPDFVLEANVVNEICNMCQINKMKFKFKRGSVPPMIEPDSVICIGGCDEMISEVLNIPRTRPPTQANPVNVNTSIRSQNGIPDSGYNSFNSTRSNNSSFNSTRTNNSQSQNNSITRNTTFNRSNSNSGNKNYTTQADVNRGGNSRPALHISQQNNMNTGNSDGGHGSAIVCNCGDDGILLTVRKDGPNQGRQFYKCSKPTGTGCNFFLWADENTTTVNSNTTNNNNYTLNRQDNYSNRPPPQANQWNNSSGDNVQCPCGLPAKSLTVQKDGPNKGRPFYGCSKPRVESCGFFQWGDQPSDGGGGMGRGNGGGARNNQTGYKRQGGAGPQTDGGGVKKRKCGICHVEGHTRKTCPQR
ncbi:hypothetical protein SNE40_019350 [Patella caerulea]|uniref:DNA topoisomerase n=2 Tax=Patella caerulea TaxID=87958 RepID=A0AAN8J6D6_PATCE